MVYLVLHPNCIRQPVFLFPLLFLILEYGKRRKQQGNYLWLFYANSLWNQNNPCNQGNHSVVKTTNLFLQWYIGTRLEVQKSMFEAGGMKVWVPSWGDRECVWGLGSRSWVWYWRCESPGTKNLGNKMWDKPWGREPEYKAWGVNKGWKLGARYDRG